MSDVRYLGYVAGALTCGAGIPQVILTYRTRRARDLSILQLVMLDIGVLLWLCYGLLQSDLPLIVANVFSTVCYTLLVAMKLRYDTFAPTPVPEGDRRVSDCLPPPPGEGWGEGAQ